MYYCSDLTIGLAYFGGTLQGECSRTAGELLLLSKRQVQAHDGAVRHDGGCNRSCETTEQISAITKTIQKHLVSATLLQSVYPFIGL